jgi:hypothetical protein
MKLNKAVEMEGLEGRRLLSAAVHMAAIASVQPAVHASVSHRHHRVRAAALTLVGNYDTTFTYQGSTIHLTLNVDHQHQGNVSGTLDATNVPFLGTASVAFTGVVNADNTFSLNFTGSANGNASGSFTSDYKSATVTYDFTAAGLTFSGTRTFTR